MGTVKRAFKAKAEPEAKGRKAEAECEKKAVPLKRSAAAVADIATPARKVSKLNGGNSKDVSIPSNTGLDTSIFDAKKDEIASWTNDKLKKQLKANDQSQSGNKASLIAKCAFGRAFGKLPRCPKCFGGKVKFRLNDGEGQLASLVAMYGGASAKDKEEEPADGEKKAFFCTGYVDDDEK